MKKVWSSRIYMATLSNGFQSYIKAKTIYEALDIMKIAKPSLDIIEIKEVPHSLLIGEITDGDN